MKPWREVVIPHDDVLKGKFQQNEFAVDMTAVRLGKAVEAYQDAAAFFERTYITEGMRHLLTQVAERLSGRGGEPVIQLQTAFGGGKTHTMLAVYHLATRRVPLTRLAGIAPLIERAGLMDVPLARVAVIDGNNRGPSVVTSYGKVKIRTLWGELAWQLGGVDGLALVREADADGTSPGKEILRTLLETFAPCVILVDELVAYVRQFEAGKAFAGGTYESNMSFAQALTEAVGLVPNAVMLASLPESEVEAGGERGVAALKALEKTFGRVQALWKPVATEEAFEIVRRRLFEPIRDTNARNETCRAFRDAYIAEGAKLPSETQESHYHDRLCQAYPIHPEVFDRLYEDWTTIEGFQRTRGVLKLMAKVIARLWQDNNQDAMILPGNLPLFDHRVRNDLTYLLPAGWDPVIDGEIDGERAATTKLQESEPRFGQQDAARRVARTLFLGSAPSSVNTKPGIRGITRGRILLGCLQPGQTSALYADALGRLLDRLHYLNPTGDKNADATRFWFDTRANLRREMEDRKGQLDKAEVLKRTTEVVRKLLTGVPMFDGLHVFTPPADIPDDTALRLVVLPPDSSFIKDARNPATDAVSRYLREHGAQPRHRANRLIFLAADQGLLTRLDDATRVSLAWEGIVQDAKELKLNIDRNQEESAKKEAAAALLVVPKVARECFRWLLCPVQEDPRAERPTVEAFNLSTSGDLVIAELGRVCRDNELIIETWAPVHLRTLLKDIYWKNGKTALAVEAFWNDSLRYLYLPRLRSLEVLTSAIRTGMSSRDFFGTAESESAGVFEGFRFGDGPEQVTTSLLLIEPEAAKQFATTLVPPTPMPPAVEDNAGGPIPAPRSGNDSKIKTPPPPPQSPMSPQGKFCSFHGSIDIPAAVAKLNLVKIADEIIRILAEDPDANLKVTVEIRAEFPKGVSDTIRRAISENANVLGFKVKDWE